LGSARDGGDIDRLPMDVLRAAQGEMDQAGADGVVAEAVD
jgi:hypothetical protein